MSTEIDPLDMPAGDQAEPSFPVLREGLKRMVIRNLEEVSSEKDGVVSKRVSISLGTTVDDRSTEDQPLHAGFGFNAVIFLTPNDRNTVKQIGENLAMPIKAALGAKTKTTMRECITNPSLLIGKVVDVKVGVRKDKSGQYGDSNTVKSWIIPS